jgi:hypothetical protein
LLGGWCVWAGARVVPLGGGFGAWLSVVVACWLGWLVAAWGGGLTGPF